MDIQNQDQIRQIVREKYGEVARSGQTGCSPSGGGHGCCGPGPEISERLGYSAEELAAGEGANLGLGCGNPQAIAAIREGEVVLDLGSGAGFDCFLAARQVGPTGQVIGVDMTADMISRARANALKLGTTNVDFRLGEIEHLPVADASVDVVISNCVINLSPAKGRVLEEVFRVLKPGGRIAISDVVLLAELPPTLRTQAEAIVGCIAGAARPDELEAALRSAGFAEVRVEVDQGSREVIRDWYPGSGAEQYVASARIQARKAGPSSCCGSSCCDEG